MLRKLLPYLLFAALGLLMLFGHPLLLAVTSFIHHAPDTVVGANATGAQVAAEQQAGGWVQAGTVASKLITAAGAYVFFVLLSWLVQHLTHPAPTRWAKGEKHPTGEKTGYSADFILLDPFTKFEVYGRLQLVNVLRAAAALLFAALVV